MKSVTKSVALILALAMSFVTLSAADIQKPDIKKYAFDDSGILTALSDNGQWAIVGFGTSDLAEAGNAKIVNILTGEYENLQTDAEISQIGKQNFNDVTDDGNIIVGSYKGAPAYWKKATREWVSLPLPKGASSAMITNVTPDGRYAIGRGASSFNEYHILAAMWDLQTGTLVELPNLPTLDMTHENQNQQYLMSISNDGRYIVGSLSYSYLQPIACCLFVYDRNTSSAKFIGYDASDTEAWKPWDDRLAFIDEGKISPNGKYVLCHATVILSGDSSNDAVAVYEVETGKFEILKGSEGMLGTAIDNYGTVYAGTPSGSPVRDWAIYHTGYWYPIDMILSQNYGVNMYATMDNTGTVSEVTGDGKTMIVMIDPSGESYSMRIPEAVSSLCDGINLLGNYMVTPAPGMTFSKLRTVELTFERDVEIVGSTTSASLTKSNGELVRNSSNILVGSADSKTVIVQFRPQDLAAGEVYTVTVPAGVIAIKGDKSKTNSEIKVNYNGRANVPVAVKEIYPQEGSVLAKIDNASNPVVVTFDSQLVITENASSTLYLIDGENTEKVCDLTSYAIDNMLYVYPPATQYLYLDKKYKVVIAAGTVTDYSGSGANEEITVNYTGSYVRNLSHDTANLFFDDFSNTSQSYINFMRYEGDHFTPSDEMAAWGFDADNQPWNFVIRDNEESADFCAASHSMYTGVAGQSDDWMVIPQLDVPDEYTSLTFKAQSYRKSKSDYLKVIVWACDQNYNTLNKDVISRIKAEGDVVFNEKLNPGTNEETLADDWTSYSVDLAKYSGKKIYIAFLNDNNNQSAVFVDDVKVTREMKFFISLTTEESVVNRKDIAIAGILTANAEGDTFNNLTMVLKDAAGNEIDKITATGLSLSKGSKYNFAFAKNLPLIVGENNKYSIVVTLDDYSDQVSLSIKNLAFEPTKRVVIEEITGVNCGYCPLGILAFEHLEALYGDLIVPVAIHTYPGDPFANSLSSYTDFLGLSAAPNGVVQRNGQISAPMATDFFTGEYTTSNGYNLWKDYVAAEFEIPADAELSAKYTPNKDENEFDLDITVKYALNTVNLNLNVFFVMVEDGIVSYQDNYLASTPDANLGEWGKGGKYGKSTNYNYSHHNIAQACWGSSYNGTAGMMPQSMTAGEEYTRSLRGFDIPETVNNVDMTKVVVMLIDGNTDKIVNVACAKAPDYMGVEDITADAAACEIAIVNGNVVVAGNGEIAATVYDAAGRAIAAGAANDVLSLPTEGYQGFAIVQAVVNGKVVVKKLSL